MQAVAATLELLRRVDALWPKLTDKKSLWAKIVVAARIDDDFQLASLSSHMSFVPYRAHISVVVA